jgi:hypothetical protein
MLNRKAGISILFLSTKTQKRREFRDQPISGVAQLLNKNYQTN